MPKISVIIPVYNTEQYLQECINSLINQSLKDIECIFVDDASTDGSPEILKKNEKKNPDLIKVVICQQNRAQGTAKNIGIQMATGEYIGFVDSDDFISHDFYENLYEKAEETNADIVYGSILKVNEDARIKNTIFGRAEKLGNKHEDITLLEGKNLTTEEKEMLITEDIGLMLCAIWRRSLFCEHDLRFPEGIKYEDTFLHPLLRAYARRVAFSNQGCYVYRQWNGSTTGRVTKEKQIDKTKADELMHNFVMKRNEQDDLYNRYKNAWDYYYTKRYAIDNYFRFHENFDDPELDLLVRIIKDVKRQCPKWHKNKFFVKNTTFKYRLLCRIIMTAPRICSHTMMRLL